MLEQIQVGQSLFGLSRNEGHELANQNLQATVIYSPLRTHGAFYQELNVAQSVSKGSRNFSYFSAARSRRRSSDFF